MKVERRFRAYNVGLPKTGTTSIAHVFSRYRSGHEFWYPQTATALARFRGGELTEAEFRAFLRQRDEAGQLEMDSASFSSGYLDILTDEFADAKFLFTIRDRYSWLDSLLNLGLTIGSGMPRWMIDYGRRALGVAGGPDDAFASRDRLVAAMPELIDGFLHFWASRNREVLARLPEGRSLVLRTPDIRRSIPQIAALLGIPEDTLDASRSHSFEADRRYHVLESLDRDWLDERFSRAGADLMERFFPDATLDGFLAASRSRGDGRLG